MLPPKSLLKNTFFIKIMNAPPKSLFNKTGIVTSSAKSDEIGKIAHLVTRQVSLRALLKVTKLVKSHILYDFKSHENCLTTLFQSF